MLKPIYNKYKPFYKENLTLAIPVVISQLGHTLVHTADSVIVGQFAGTIPLAAVSLVNSIFMVVMVIGIGISYGLTPLIAQENGRNNTTECSRLLSNSLMLNVVFGFLRDAYDHSIQIIDLIETMRETATSLLDLYLSLMSNKMNEVMKTLTIISAIFIPLTFIVGVYGMNFAYQDPKTGKILDNNMPELYIENGYLYVLGLMFLIVIGQIWYFGRKGWFKD